MSEESLWGWLKTYLPAGQYSRIESPDTSPGIPDVFYQARLPTRDATGFLELKFSRTPEARIPFKNREDGLHLSQEIWLRENWQAGGHSMIVAQVGKQVLFIGPHHAPEFNGSTLNRLTKISSLILPKTKMTGKDVRDLWRIL